MISMPTSLKCTDWWAAHYTGFQGAHDYYAHYTIAADGFRDLKVHTSIIHAANDGVIPVQNFYDLEPNLLLICIFIPMVGMSALSILFPFHHYFARFGDGYSGCFVMSVDGY